MNRSIHRSLRRRWNSTNGEGKRRSGINRNVGIAVFGAGVAGLVGLGSWQLYRRQWKQGITAERENQVKCAPQPLSELLSRNEDLNFRPVSVRGVYDYSRQVFIGPRNLEAGAGGEIGFYLLTPLIMSSGEEILVNRGWIAKTRRKNDPICAETFQGQAVEVSGLLSPTEPRNRYLQNWEPTGDKKDWIVLDVPALHQHMNTRPLSATSGFVLEAQGENNKGITRKGVQSHLAFKVTPESHLIYAATWYSLAACLALITVKRFR